MFIDSRHVHAVQLAMSGISRASSFDLAPVLQAILNSHQVTAGALHGLCSRCCFPSKLLLVLILMEFWFDYDM